MSIPSSDNAKMNAQGRAQLQMEALHRLTKRRMTEGNAGGFFDRQDGGDRKEWDSDDEEFDEFGRRKRRKAGAGVKKKERPPAEKPPEASSAPSAPPGANMLSYDISQDDSERVEGYVRWYEKSKHFGFLRTAGIDVDIYFKDQDRTLGVVEGMKVTFLLKTMPDGKLQARKIIPGRLSSLLNTGAAVTS
eukprot:TRINITY_DN65760_c0_g1_i1.p1 TRINITY_DN65760_c0_g1~~TRINITY_DN65760_c0_g1_i1.p1  ORF type:complete len:190 (-),score=49.11 TRINITY_DN65760_c0_g1_i1:102-671(-)